MRKTINYLMLLSCLILSQGLRSANVYKEMNIYATVLSVKTQMTNTSRKATVRFFLASPAKGVWIYVDQDNDGNFEESELRYSNANQVLRRDGYSEISFTLPDDWQGGDYNWAVKVQGAPQGTDYGKGKSKGFNTADKPELARVYHNTDHRYEFDKPKGLAVNTNYDSKYCGYIYVGEAGSLSGLAKNPKRPIRLGSSQGLYAFNPTMGTIWSHKKDAVLNNAPYGAFTGDVSWFEVQTDNDKQYCGPSHVSVGDDEYVYISQNHPTRVGGEEVKERIWRVKASDLKDNNKNAQFQCIMTTKMLDEQNVGGSSEKLYKRVLAMSIGKIDSKKILYVISGYSDRTYLTDAALSSWEIKENNDGTCTLTFIKSMNLKNIPYGSNNSNPQDLNSQYCSVVPGNDNGDLWLFQRVLQNDVANNIFAAIRLIPTNTGWTINYRIPSSEHLNLSGAGTIGKHYTIGNNGLYYLAFPSYLTQEKEQGVKVFRIYKDANGFHRSHTYTIINPEDAKTGFDFADGVAIDAANNIFFGSSVTNKVYAYALPKENEHTTPSNLEAKLHVPYHVKWVDEQSGTVISGKKHKYMFSTDKLPVLSKRERIFQGWYEDENFSGAPVSSITRNCTLYAKWIEEYKSIGVFSVSDKKMVTFSPGNLQRNLRAEKWMFASEQYEMLGVANVKNGNITSDGTGQGKENKTAIELADQIDLFGWSSDRSNPHNDFGVSIADIKSYYGGNFLDWGINPIGDDAPNIWQTLSYDEWQYLRTGRKNANQLMAIARIDFAGVNNANGDAYVNGLILLPDDWYDEDKVKPTDLIVKPGFHAKNSSGIAHENYYADYQNPIVFSIKDWKKLEAAGAVFLPAAGIRAHNTTPVDGVYRVTGIYNTRYMGHYWSSTSYNDPESASHFGFNSAEAYVTQKNARWAGRSVRLVHDTLPIVVDAGTTKVTSTAGQTIKKIVRITLLNHFKDKSPTIIYGSSDNPAFTVTTLHNVGPGEQELIVHYNPTLVEDGIETATIILTSSTLEGKTSFTMTGRHLPKNFVIAAKEGDEWVALTANVTNGTQQAVPIFVDNPTTPTKATVALSSCQYQLLGLENNRYTVNGTAAHLYSTQTHKVLNASTDSNTKTYLSTDTTHAYAQTSANALYYEWNLLSEDLVHYTITNSNQTTGWENNSILGHSSTSTMWGMYQEDETVNQEIFLLPVETTLTDQTEVMEWSKNSMVLRIKDAIPSNINITLAGTTTSKPLTNLEGSDLYQVSDIDLTKNDCETMIIKDGSNNGTILRKPILVSEEAVSTTFESDYCHHCDVVILNGATLSADEEHVDFANLYIYPGGHLVLDNQSLGVKQQVYLRGGYSWLNPTTYALPEVYLNDTINFTGSNNIIYDYYIKNYQYFQFALPYTVPLANVTDEAGYDNFPVWVKHYNGALRAADPYATSWDWYYGDDFERGIGYVIAAKPRQEGNTANRPLSIIRFPLGNEELNTTNIEPNLEDILTTAHGIDGYKAGTVTANNVGWHLLGNPFMSTWKGDIGHHQLEQNIVDDKWDGSYNWIEGNVKYLTIMSPENGYDYNQYVAANTELKPFFPFFMQEAAAGGSGSIDFVRENRIRTERAPARIYENEAPEVFVQVEIVTDKVDDQTGLFISNTYSDDIDLDDYEKLFGSSTDKAKLWLVHQDKRMAFEAITPANTASYIALGYRAPKAGNYRLVINEEISTLGELIAVYLTDHELGITDYDLLSHAYTFESQATTYCDHRFTIRIVLKDHTNDYVTSVDNLGTTSKGTYKFLYQDQMYIYKGGVIYDATGKQVTNVNK